MSFVTIAASSGDNNGRTIRPGAVDDDTFAAVAAVVSTTVIGHVKAA